MRKQKFMPRKLILLLSVPIPTSSFKVPHLLKLLLPALNSPISAIQQRNPESVAISKMFISPLNVKVTELMAVGMDNNIKLQPFN